MEQLEQYLKFLNYIRPLEPYIINKLEEHLKIEYIYNSNGIEGNTLTYNETKVILKYGVTVKGKSLKEHLEVKGQEYGISYLQEIVKEKTELNIRLIKEFHHLILAPINIEIAGVFKKKYNMISGSNIKTTSPFEVENELNKLINDYNSSKEDIISKITKFHADFEKIHPFEDGNGRVGRLIMNMELMKKGYPICIIKKTDRLKYYVALEKAQVYSDYTQIISFIKRNIYKSFEIYFKYSLLDWKKEFQEWMKINKI